MYREFIRPSRYNHWRQDYKNDIFFKVSIETVSFYCQDGRISGRNEDSETWFIWW